MVSQISIGGRTVYRPGPYAEVDDSAFRKTQAPVLKRLAIIAPANGGAPGDWTLLATPDQAARVLRDGIGLDLCDLAFDPSPDRPGAGEIAFYRVNKAVAASLDLGDVVLTVRPALAGLFGNGVRAKRDTYPATTAKVLTLDPGNMDRSGPEVSPPLGPALRISYTGAGTPGGSLSVSGGQKTLTLTAGPGEGLAVAIGGAGLKTFADLAAFLNGSNTWVAEVLYQHALYNPGDLPLGALTFTANAALLDLGPAAQLAWLANSRLVTAVAGSAAASGTDAGWLYFTGGGEGPAVTNQDYLDALNAALDQDVQAICVGTSDPTVQAAAAAHAAEASHPKNRHERVFFGGAALAPDAATELANALTLRQSVMSETAVVAWKAVQRPNMRTGLLDQLSPHYVAAMLAGLYCGAQPDESLTWANVKAVGLVFKSSQAEYERALQNGVVGIFKDDEDGTFKVDEGITTSADQDNLMRYLLKGTATIHHLNRGIRRAVKRFTGQQADQIRVESIVNAAVSYLKSQVSSAANPHGVLTAGIDANGLSHNGFRNVTAVYEGQNVVGLDYEAFAGIEIGFIHVRATLEPTRIVVTG